MVAGRFHPGPAQRIQDVEAAADPEPDAQRIRNK